MLSSTRLDEQGASKEQIEQIQKPLAEQLAAQNALIKMLLEKNTAAGPGAQQAVGTAVESIAQGASEGDARLRQALDLLKANKIADAERLLNAVAEDKTAAEQATASAEQETARAAKDRKEAAIAYLGLVNVASWLMWEAAIMGPFRFWWRRHQIKPQHFGILAFR